MARLTAMDVARYFLAKVGDLDDEETDDYICNMKLQKLVYYAQGTFLAIHGKPLFDEPIEAWTHGPVVPSVYREFKDHGARPIAPVRDLDESLYSAEVSAVLDDVWDVFGQYSGRKLRSMTHEEPPWRNTRSRQTISLDSMREYFKTLLVDND